MLKLNQDMFKFIMFHPKTQTFDAHNLNIFIDNSSFLPSSHVKNLGDKTLTLEKTCIFCQRSCYRQILCISKIRQYITKDACRSLLGRLVQNTCACLVTRTVRSDHITPVLIELHCCFHYWLPMEYRTYKVVFYTYKALSGLAP